MISKFISDSRLHSFWKQCLKKYPNQLKSQRYCCSKIALLPRAIPAVYVISNGKEAKLTGVTHCSNPWICPVCAPKRIAQLRTKVECAFSAIAQENKQVGIMLTFTVPHTARQTLEQTLTILRQTWGKFSHHVNVVSNTCQSPFSRFNRDFNCFRRLRALEVTYGKNGWHPHFHALWFIDKDKLDDVLSREKELADVWEKHTRKVMVQVLTKLEMRLVEGETVQKYVDDLYAKKHDKNRALFISKNDDGSIRIADSAAYVSGLAVGANELTKGALKKAADNHLTPFQMLEKAYSLTKEGNHADAEFYIKLLIHFAHRMMRCPRTKTTKPLNELINKFIESNGYVEILKKKAIRRGTNSEKWKVVISLPKFTWYEILDYEREHGVELMAEILELSIYRRRQLIEDYLRGFGIIVPKIDAIEEQAKFIEERVLNIA